MEETISQDNLNACVVCHMIIQDTTTAIKKRYGDVEDVLIFCSDGCYKKYLENPDFYNYIQEDATE